MGHLVYQADNQYIVEYRTEQSQKMPQLYAVYFPGDINAAMTQTAHTVSSNLGTFASQDMTKITEVIHASEGGIAAQKMEDEESGRKFVKEASRSAALWNPKTQTIIAFKKPLYTFVDSKSQLE